MLFPNGPIIECCVRHGTIFNRVETLTGSTTLVEFDGTSVTRKVLDGRADLEEFETDSPAGGHI